MPFLLAQPWHCGKESLFPACLNLLQRSSLAIYIPARYHQQRQMRWHKAQINDLNKSYATVHICIPKNLPCNPADIHFCALGPRRCSQTSPDTFVKFVHLTHRCAVVFLPFQKWLRTEKAYAGQEIMKRYFQPNTKRFKVNFSSTTVRRDKSCPCRMHNVELKQQQQKTHSSRQSHRFKLKKPHLLKRSRAKKDAHTHKKSSHDYIANHCSWKCIYISSFSSVGKGHPSPASFLDCLGDAVLQIAVNVSCNKWDTVLQRTRMPTQLRFHAFACASFHAQRKQ